MVNLKKMGEAARVASHKLALATEEQKNHILSVIADQIWAHRLSILESNLQDIELGRKAGMSDALLDRLTLNETRLEGVINDLRKVIEIKDPVGERFDHRTMPNGLKIYKQRVPLGVLAVIYEARPNVTVDVVGLSIKSGNAVILRGGSETMRTNLALVNAIHTAFQKSTLPADLVQFIDDTDRALVAELLKMYEHVDMLIPRGGAALHKFCRENSMIPVITGGIGICHLFVDQSADLEASLEVIYNAKVQRPSVCNALDTVLIHRQVAQAFLPSMVARFSGSGVVFRVHESVVEFITPDDSSVFLAGKDDFDQEWLSLVLGVKVVNGLGEALEHIAIHSTAHSDGILTNDSRNAERFVSEVDSAAVYVNASTRFTDGSQLGLGAEVAISTQRLHARGPMALEELTTYKWVVSGSYHVRP